MLPDGFTWRPVLGGNGPHDSLACRGYEVARLTEKVCGGWLALLHYPDGRRVIRDCTSYDAGKAGCEAWAARHQVALHAQLERRELEWLANQTWRGEDSVRARRELAALAQLGG